MVSVRRPCSSITPIRTRTDHRPRADGGNGTVPVVGSPAPIRTT